MPVTSPEKAPRAIAVKAAAVEQLPRRREISERMGQTPCGAGTEKTLKGTYAAAGAARETVATARPRGYPVPRSSPHPCVGVRDIGCGEPGPPDHQRCLPEIPRPNLRARLGHKTARALRHLWVVEEGGSSAARRAAFPAWATCASIDAP